jgi:DNA-binding response OmpR family regulator
MRTLPIDHDEVKLVRWPVERDRLRDYRRTGVPRLLVVEAGAQPPVCSDVVEDWVRTPVSPDDVAVRIASLRARRRSMRRPRVDPTGVLRVGDRSVPLSPTETELLGELVGNYGAMTSTRALTRRLTDQSPASGANALHTHIKRIRRRIGPLGLAIRTVWGRGYLLELAEEPT